MKQIFKQVFITTCALALLSNIGSFGFILKPQIAFAQFFQGPSILLNKIVVKEHGGNRQIVVSEDLKNPGNFNCWSMGSGSRNFLQDSGGFNINQLSAGCFDLTLGEINSQEYLAVEPMASPSVTIVTIKLPAKNLLPEWQYSPYKQTSLPIIPARTGAMALMAFSELAAFALLRKFTLIKQTTENKYICDFNRLGILRC